MVVDIQGYEGLYTIDDKGNIYSIRKKLYIKPIVNHNGCYELGLYGKDGYRTTKLLHTLVAKHFVRSNFRKVRFINGNTLDVNAKNLQPIGIWRKH